VVSRPKISPAGGNLNTCRCKRRIAINQRKLAAETLTARTKTPLFHHSNIPFRSATGVEIQRPFGEPEHAPFSWQAGEQAALLIHGFPGTPAEMRPLGALLHDAGWTVHAPLLPGFGPEIGTLSARSHREWIGAARESYQRLRRQYQSCLIVGNSMGAALAMIVAAEQPPAGLVLIAPFLRFAAGWHHFFWPILKRIVREIRPFQHADFASPEIRRAVARMFQDANPDSAEVQRFVRAISVPTGALDQVREIGRAATRTTARLQPPILILQGRSDGIVPPHRTRALRQRLRGSAYVELDAGHDLVEPDGGAWLEVAGAVTQFAADVKKS
jgi:carboxylesterase